MLVASRARLKAVVDLDTSLGNNCDGVEDEPIHIMEDIVRPLEVSLQPIMPVFSHDDERFEFWTMQLTMCLFISWAAS